MTQLAGGYRAQHVAVADDGIAAEVGIIGARIAVAIHIINLIGEYRGFGRLCGQGGIGEHHVFGAKRAILGQGDGEIVRAGGNIAFQQS